MKRFILLIIGIVLTSGLSARDIPAKTYPSGQTTTESGPTTLDTVSNTITAPSGATVIYVASASIRLGPGFTAAQGSNFHALIDANAPAISGSPLITAQPSDQVKTTGDTAQFALSAAGAATLTYQWQRQPVGTSGFVPLSDGGAYSGATTAVLSIASVTPSMSGDQFRCVVASGVPPDATSAESTLTVFSPGVVITSADHATFTKSQSNSFSITATGAPPITYAATNLPDWATLDANSGVLSGSPTDVAGAPFTLTLTASNASGSAQQTFTLTVIGTPMIAVQPQPASLVAGTSSSLAAFAFEGGGATYQWWKNGIQLAGATTNVLDLKAVTGSAAGNYYITVSNASGTVTSSSIAVTVNDPPQITSQSTDQTATVGGNLSLSVEASGSGALTTTWMKDGVVVGSGNTLTLNAVTYLSEGAYVATVSSPYGSVSSAPIFVKAVKGPSVQITSVQRAVLANELVTMVATASGDPSPTYQWYNNGTAIPGATKANLTFPDGTYRGAFYVTATNSVGSASSTTVTFNSPANAIPQIQAQPVSVSATTGNDVAFSVAATGCPAPQYQWKKNGTPISGETMATLLLPSVGATDAASYTVVVSNTLGSVTSTVASLAVSSSGTQSSFEFSYWGFTAKEGFVTGSIDGQKGWTVPSGSATVNSGIVDLSGATTDASLKWPLGWAFNSAPDATFVDTHVVMQAGTDPNSSANVQFRQAMFVLIKDGANGVVWYRLPSSITWYNTGAKVALDLNNYGDVRLTMRITGNFNSLSWDLYVNGKLTVNDQLMGPPYFDWYTYSTPHGTDMLVESAYVGAHNPLFTDVDGNGIDDAWEINHGIVGVPRSTDSDGDGLANVVEYIYGTNPVDPDSDHDGLTDFQEIMTYHTDPNNPDTDGEGLPDGWEVRYGLNPLSSSGVNGATGDSDGDGLSNLQEFLLGTSPVAIDSDNDGVADNIEWAQASNPNDASDQGHAPPTGKVVNVSITYGDPHSLSVMQLTIQGTGRDTRVLNYRTSGQGNETISAPLLQGASYVVRLRRVSDVQINPLTPDSDYTLLIEQNPGADFFGVKNLWIADNRDHLETDYDQDDHSGIEGKQIVLNPLSLLSDFNNDGKIDDADAAANATEYLFVNDSMSNGTFDIQDPNVPSGLSVLIDDDAKPLKATVGVNSGYIWFDHPSISNLKFYSNRMCRTTDEITFPFDLTTGALPSRIYVRTTGTISQEVSGSLSLNYGTQDKATVYAQSSLPLIIVSGVGDQHFFNACRDYILENNTRFYATRKLYGSEAVRLVVMREEATSLKVLDTYNYDTAHPLLGIDKVVSTFGGTSGLSVIVNGNYGATAVGAMWTSPSGKPVGIPTMVFDTQCLGTLISGGVFNAAASLPAGSSNPYYIAQSTNGAWTFASATGEVPQNAGYAEAMGGLRVDYSGAEASAANMVGEAPVGTNKMVFVAMTDLTINNGSHASEVTGFVADAKTGSGATQVLLLDGGSSVAMAYRTPDDTLTTQFKGLKHNGIGYYINTYLGFTASKPR